MKKSIETTLVGKEFTQYNGGSKSAALDRITEHMYLGAYTVVDVFEKFGFTFVTLNGVTENGKSIRGWNVSIEILNTSFCEMKPGGWYN